MDKSHLIIILIIVLFLLWIICDKSFRTETDMYQLAQINRRNKQLQQNNMSCNNNMDNYHKYRKYKDLYKQRHQIGSANNSDSGNIPGLNKSINLHHVERLRKRYSGDPENKILQNAISKNPAKEVLLENDRIKHINHHFSNTLETKIKISDQKATGRCWIFSFLNMFRYQIIQELNLPDDFQFSQNYLYFYDKLEKCYYFLQNIANTKSDTLQSRRLDWLLNNTLSDGGNWNMLVNLINKYGIVPKSAMPETYQSNNSYQLNVFLKQNLKTMTYNIRNGNLNGKGLYEYLQEQIYLIYKLLVIFLGNPPTVFSWHYTQKKSDKVISIPNLTPVIFAKKYFKFNEHDWVLCGNFPVETYPFYKLYNIKMCNNMIDGKNTEIFNLPIENLIEYSKKSIDDQLPVWIAVDWGKFNSCEYSSLDLELYDYQRLGYKVLDKGISLQYKLSIPNHAVLIIGYNLDNNGKIDKWLIDNSHGDDKCKLGKEYEAKKLAKGYHIMTHDWFKQYVYLAVAKRKYLSKQLTKLLSEPPIELDPWETIGCEVLTIYNN